MPPPELTPVPDGKRDRARVVHAHALQTDALRTCGDGCSDAAQSSAALSAPQHLLGEQRTVALHFNVDVVFDRERDHVLRREVQIARADQRIQARRIRQPYRRNAPAADRDA